MSDRPNVQYHSDVDGLVYGFLLEPDQPARPITTHEALEWMRLPADRAGGTFVWLHFALSNTGTARWLKAHMTLPGSVEDTILGAESSPRIDNHEGTVLAVLKDVLFDFSFGVSEIATLFGILTPRYFITLRSKQLRTIERLRSDVRSGERFRNSTELLARLLRHQADVLEAIQHETTDKVDAMEDSVLANRSVPARSELGTLRRVLVRLQRLLAPEPAALYRLINKPPVWMDEAAVLDLRQSVEEFQVVLGDIHQLNERIKLLQEELGMRETEKTNRSLFTLTLVTVLAVPFNVAGGLFGMNVGGIPWSQDAAGFWSVVGLVLSITTIAFVVMRRRL